MPKFIFTFLFLFVSICCAKEPPNIYFAQQKLISYHHSGEYYHDVEDTINKARNCLKTSIEDSVYSNSIKKPAVILDIDDTSLALIGHKNKMSFGMSLKEFNAVVEKADEKALLATLDLYNYIKSQGVGVFFISGRLEALREVTIKNLKNAGYKNWDGLFLNSNHNSGNHKKAAEFKLRIRNMIRSKGYNILGNIGDQESDLIGDDVRCKFKLPNPYYFVN